MVANTKQMTASPASSWKRKVELLELPSGQIVEVVRPDVMALVLDDGSLPNGLLQLMLGITEIAEGQTEEEVTQEVVKDFSAQDFKALNDLYDRMFIACVKSVTVLPAGSTPNYDEGEISMSDVDKDDKQFVANWAMKGGSVNTEAVGKFPKK